jgi:hypothetical protein
MVVIVHRIAFSVHRAESIRPRRLHQHPCPESRQPVSSLFLRKRDAEPDRQCRRGCAGRLRHRDGTARDACHLRQTTVRELEMMQPIVYVSNID